MSYNRYADFAERFQQVIKEHAGNIGQLEIARLLGTSQSIISRALNGQRLPSDDVMERVKDLWGVDMVSYVRQQRSDNRYVVPKSIPEKSEREGVPYYDVDFVGGFDIIVNDQTVNPSYMINFKPYERATCWCNITGHSMEPEIGHGDIIALRRIEDMSYLPYGEIYAIVTRNDMRTVKRLGPGSTRDTYMLIPANKSPEYAPQEIYKKDILYIYEVMGCMKKF